MKITINKASETREPFGFVTHAGSIVLFDDNSQKIILSGDGVFYTEEDIEDFEIKHYLFEGDSFTINL